MFTGLVKEIGKIKSIQHNKEGILFGVKCINLISEMEIDDSVAIDGACQTVVRKGTETFYVQSVHVTLEKTIFKNYTIGSEVNLELALRMSDRIGGHLVQGHVNGIGKIDKIESQGDNYLFRIYIDKSLMKYVIKEGSIALNGVSLTLSNVNANENWVEVSIIPHTFFHTNFHRLKSGSLINVEVDFLAKYLENFVANLSKNNNQTITEDWLKSKGY